MTPFVGNGVSRVAHGAATRNRRYNLFQCISALIC